MKEITKNALFAYLWLRENFFKENVNMFPMNKTTEQIYLSADGKELRTY